LEKKGSRSRFGKKWELKKRKKDLDASIKEEKKKKGGKVLAVHEISLRGQSLWGTGGREKKALKKNLCAGKKVDKEKGVI